MSTALEMSEATKSVGGLTVSYRPGTADEQVLDLVLAHNRYQDALGDRDAMAKLVRR